MRHRKRAVLFFAVVGVLLIGTGGYIHLKAICAQYLLDRAWDKTITEKKVNKPWPWADTWPVARLTVPAYNIDHIVLSGVDGSTLAFGPGHMISSALPGTAGNTIISGHRDTCFSFLRNIQSGEVVYLQTADGTTHTYRVFNTAVADADHLGIRTYADAPYLTLVTCYPFDAIIPGGPERFLVFAEYSGRKNNKPS
jgi:sortase A